MRNYYIMFAVVVGLMLTACSQEDAIVTNQSTQQTEQAVTFDTYLSNTKTRAGKTGTMSTTTLQQTYFGIFAVTHNLSSVPVSAGTEYPHKLNFMWNQEVRYEASNWVYSPLKYWPNETATTQGTLSDADQQKAQATDREGVSFFAYAPYVNAGSDGVVTDSPTDMGITNLTANNVDEGAKVTYTAADGSGSSNDDGNNHKPSKSVDLLWGTSSGFSYHPVRTNTAEIKTAGLPVINMEKPGLDEKIKFDFKHALARIGMTVVGAFDQAAAGGSKSPSTKVTIKEITITGKDFGIKGVLDLNNGTPNLAKWINVKNSAGTDLEGSTVTSVVTIDNGTYSEMNSALKYNDAINFPTNAGVYSTEQNVISAGSKFTPVTGKPDYSPNTYYYTAENDVVAVAQYNTTMFEADGKDYKKLTGTVDVTKAIKNYYKVSPTTIDYNGSSCNPAVNDKDVLFTKSGEDYIYAGIVGTDDATLFDGSTHTYYTLSVENAVPVYPDGTYYTRNDVPGYFMVIPYNRASNLNKATVTVKITYYVTTYDANLQASSASGDNTVSQIENVISQDVDLNDFGNGKAYNLKLILGLTSVKVDAEVTNWEVGTVESNLPQNLE